MWNSVHLNLLRTVIEGTNEMARKYIPDTRLVLLRDINSQCLNPKYKKLLEINEINENSLDIIHEACLFLIEEFAEQPREEEISSSDGVLTIKHEKKSRLVEKLTLCRIIPFIPPELLKEAYKQHSLNIDISRPIDCLFVTALRVEYLAIVRRIDYFYYGSDPKTTHGFYEFDDDVSIKAGWISGFIKDKDKLISVMAICCRRYGSVEANMATIASLPFGKPKYIIVVGIAASLDNRSKPSKFNLGDVGISQKITDITLGRDVSNNQITSSVQVKTQPILSRITQDLQQKIKYENGHIHFTGILSEVDIHGLQVAFDDEQDKNCIFQLFFRSLKNEQVDLSSNKRTVTCPENIIEKVNELSTQESWRSKVHLQQAPGDFSHSPQARIVNALSGSRVVKQEGMRDYLIDTFPEYLLLEMEGAGVVAACQANNLSMPIIVKSACDWADPRKNKVLQPYCADVAAAFAVQLALELSV